MGEETIELVNREETAGWSRRELLVMVGLMSLFMAEGVELYLPGVITEAVSCAMELSRVPEVLLGSSLYIALTVSTLGAGYLANKWGTRNVIILSMYLSVISIILCVSLPDSYTLILSRALIGLSLGLTFGNAITYLGNNLAPAHRVLGLTITVMCFTVAAAWISLFGFLILDIVGWRIFVAVSSMPLFVLPLILFHFYLPESQEVECDEVGGQSFKPLSIDILQNKRFVKRLLLDFSVAFIGYGEILLLPILIRYVNKEHNMTDEGGCATSAVQGEELLYLTIAGAAHIAGRSMAYIIRRHVTFQMNVTLSGFFLILCHISILVFSDNKAVIVTAMGLVKLFYAMAIMDIGYMSTDVEYFGSENYKNANTISFTVSALGGAAGVANAMIINSPDAVWAPLLMCVILMVTGWSVNDFERD